MLSLFWTRNHHVERKYWGHSAFVRDLLIKAECPHQGVQAISMLSNQTVSVFPIDDEVLKRIRVLDEMKLLILWLVGT
jgi:hypothetical protein